MGEMNYIAEAIHNNLTEENIKFGYNAEKNTFQLVYTIGGTINYIYYIIQVRDKSYIVYSYSPIKPDTDNREQMADMCEFFTRANYGIANGNFEMDMSDGEIRYKCYYDCTDSAPGKETVKESVVIPAVMFRRYAPGIIGILYSGLTAEAAIKICEKA